MTSSSFPQKYKVQGKIINTDCEPIGLTNVLLISTLDSILINGSFSDDKGIFKITNIPPGDDLLKACCLLFSLRNPVYLNMIKVLTWAKPVLITNGTNGTSKQALGVSILKPRESLIPTRRPRGYTLNKGYTFELFYKNLANFHQRLSFKIMIRNYCDVLVQIYKYYAYHFNLSISKNFTNNWHFYFLSSPAFL